MITRVAASAVPQPGAHAVHVALICGCVASDVLLSCPGASLAGNFGDVPASGRKCTAAVNGRRARVPTPAANPAADVPQCSSWRAVQDAPFGVCATGRFCVMSKETLIPPSFCHRPFQIRSLCYDCKPDKAVMLVDGYMFPLLVAMLPLMWKSGSRGISMNAVQVSTATAGWIGLDLLRRIVDTPWAVCITYLVTHGTSSSASAEFKCHASIQQYIVHLSLRFYCYQSCEHGCL
jgi:hypothetical protein